MLNLQADGQCWRRNRKETKMLMAREHCYPGSRGMFTGARGKLGWMRHRYRLQENRMEKTRERGGS